MADPHDDFSNHSTTEIEPEEVDLLSGLVHDHDHDPQWNRKTTIDPSASLAEVIALATPIHDSPPITALPPIATTPYDRLHNLIQADRHPPGQRAIFAAIDALLPDLSREEAFEGLKVALGLLSETLENALDDPSVIQQHAHVREKLLKEYLGLPEEVLLGDDTDVEGLVREIKDMVGSRWRVEAMEKQF